jgi:lambda family phage portal protein
MELIGPFGADRLRAWARDLVRNNAYAWGVRDTIVSSVVGCGIKAQSVVETPTGDDIENINDIRDRIWSWWCEVCDINGQYTLEELQAIAQGEIVEAGEVLIRRIYLKSNEYRGILRPVPLALEIIEADRLAGDKDTYATNIAKVNGNRIIRGVEVDDLGKPVAYWVYKDHPNQPYAFTRTPERIPAREILHLFRQERVGQTRGVTWFAPVISSIRDIGTFLDNELQASAIASCFSVAIKTDSPAGNLSNPDGSPTDESGNDLTHIEPGIIMRLKPNESVEGINPGRPNSAADPWIKMILRQIAVGTGLSYETVARDYSQTTYSASRTSQLEDRRRFRQWQHYLIRHMLQPIWDEFFNVAAFSSVAGFPTSTELLIDRRAAAPVEWQTPEWEWVDPSVEQQTAQAAIDNMMSTYQSELGSRGKNYRSVFYQRAKEERLLKKLQLQTPQQKQLEVSAMQSGAVAKPDALSEQANSTAEEIRAASNPSSEPNNTSDESGVLNAV